jgi:hypothetical protein
MLLASLRFSGAALGPALCSFIATMVLASSLSPLNALAANMENREAVIPPQCYTRTEGKFNPCYVCHQTHPEGTRTNLMSDGVIQGLYIFSDFGETNRWSNLFKDRSAAIAEISDQAILEYVRTDNYQALLDTYSERVSGEGQNPATEPEEQAYIPDLQGLGNAAGAFDERGLAKDGSGWVAFNYKPLPSTFWPTNGNFDDVMIRLPESFRRLQDGTESQSVYWLNLALVEMAIKDLASISIPPTGEVALQLDLDANGMLSTANRMLARTHYLGAASEVEVVRQSYPTGTEFLHSVRYLDLDDRQQPMPATRLKELRYSRKYKSLSNASISFMYNQEDREKAEERLPKYSWAKPAPLAGMNNKMGWLVQGWIEDADGQLRLQNYEENFFCMGCHTTIGTTIDHTFAFPRKVTGISGWGYLNLKGMSDVPNVGSSRAERLGEIATYLQRVGGGDEFRQNQEMLSRWFTETGKLKLDEVRQADVYQLITPTPERAMALNKAYQQIVLEQSFIYGRDALLGQAPNVYQQVDQTQAPILPPNKRFHYDLRLQWPDAQPTPAHFQPLVSAAAPPQVAGEPMHTEINDIQSAQGSDPGLPEKGMSGIQAGLLAMAVMLLLLMVALLLKRPGSGR